MSATPLQIARVSMQMRNSLLLGTLQSGQVDLLKVQTQIATGQRLSLPSDDPAAAVGIERLRQQLADNSQYTGNLAFASGFLSSADSALGSLSTLLQQAQQIASSQVGAGSSPDEREAQAAVIDSLLNRALTLANTRYQGATIFGGSNGTQDVFTALGGGYKYQGSLESQDILAANGQSLPFTLDGNAIFGGLSAQVVGYQDISPALTSLTRLVDMTGALGQGVTTSPIQVTSGATTLTIDLTGAATVGDVLNILQTQLAPLGATVSTNNRHIRITAGAGNPLTISDIGTGTAAADLGIAMTVPAGTAVDGQALPTKLSPLDGINTLRNGLGVPAGSFTITNGTLSATINPIAYSNVQGLLNAINSSGTQVRAEINAAGTGINIFNALSGTELRISENGSTTADALGIRSFRIATPLADLNGSAGVTPIAGTLPGPGGDLVVTTTSGTTFSVNIDGIKTAADLQTRINTAAGNTTVTAALNPTGNGLTLTDTSGGGGNLTVAPAANFQSNGSTLGILGAGTGATLTGSGLTLSTDDIRITRRDGVSFTVSFQGATTIQDVLNAINAAPGNTGPTRVNASLNTVGNGLSLTDNSAGAGLLTVASLNASSAAGQLGILKTAPAGTPGQIAGDDVNPIKPSGIFSSLALLRDSLRSNDDAGIARAATQLGQDTRRVVTARGSAGARAKDVSARQDQAASDKLALQSALSLLADTDMTEAITKFQTLQTAYEGGLKVSQSTQNLSLLDFLK